MKVGVIGVILVLVSVACVSPQASTATTRPRDSLRITQDEIVASLAVDAYDAIAKLRSNFLGGRGPTSIRSPSSAMPWVFVDGIEYGPISMLAQIPASAISEIRLLRSWEATTIYGTGYMSGVIAVSTRR